MSDDPRSYEDQMNDEEVEKKLDFYAESWDHITAMVPTGQIVSSIGEALLMGGPVKNQNGDKVPAVQLEFCGPEGRETSVVRFTGPTTMLMDIAINGAMEADANGGVAGNGCLREFQYRSHEDPDRAFKCEMFLGAMGAGLAYAIAKLGKTIDEAKSAMTLKLLEEIPTLDEDPEVK